MTARLFVLAAVLAASLGAGPAKAAAPQLQVAGNRLVDTSTGQTFVPRGVDWPSFEFACFYGFAYSDSTANGSVNPDAAGAAMIAGWHVNTVRIPLNEACWLGVDAQPAFGTAAGYRDAVRQWVDTLHAAGMAVILDLHWLAPAGVPAEGQRAMPDARAADFWTSVATMFKDDHAVMFDLFNEPYSRFANNGTPIIDLTWSCWRDGGCAVPTANDQQPVNGKTYPALGMAQMVNAVRAAGATQPVLLAGRDYANDLGEWLTSRPPDGQVVASFHNYDGQACNTAACWDSTIAPIAAQVPVVETEFGDTDCTDAHMNAAMDWADRHGVGYLAWAWWVLSDPSCKTLALLADQSGTPRAPNGTALHAHLAALAALAASPASGGSNAVAPPGRLGSLPAGGVPTGTHVALGGKTVQRLRSAVLVTVTCSARCGARATGRVVATLRGHRRALRLRAALASLAAGQTATLRLGLPQAVRRARRATALVTVKVGATTLTRRIALRR